MPAYKVSYRRFQNSTEPYSSNLVWAESYGMVAREFEKCAWFSAHVAPVWEIKECRAKGMPERWL